MIIVPFGRTLRLGMFGKDVLATKRGLARAGHGTLGWATRSGPGAGPRWRTRMIAFQKEKGLQADGIYGPETHKRLSRYFDDYAVWLYAGQRTRTKRDQIAAAALYFHSINYRVHYTQGAGRMSIVRNKLRPPIPLPTQVYEDCSSFVTGLYWIAGAPDPNGRGYDGYGFTGTLAEHGKAVSLADARPGDLLFYGHGVPWHHVAVLVANGRAVSHGSEAGPLIVVPTYRSDFGQARSYLP